MKEELEFVRHVHSNQRAQLEQRHEGMKRHRVAKELEELDIAPGLCVAILEMSLESGHRPE